MTTHGKRPRQERYTFHGLPTKLDMEVTDVGGASSFSSPGKGYAKTVSADGQSMFIAFPSTSLPYQLGLLQCLEFTFHVDKIEANAEIAMGVVNVPLANPSVAPVRGLLRTNGSAVTLESDNGTTEKTGVATDSILTAGWNRVRLDFRQAHQTVGPPDKSLGDLMTALITNDRGFDRRVQVNTSMDLSGNTDTAVTPYFLVRTDIAALANPVTVILNEICAEFVSPF